MAAKKRALSIVLAIVAIFASSSALASIPRVTILDEQPSIDFRHDPPAVVNDTFTIDNAALLEHAIDSALIEPAPVESLSESRVWVSRLERPLFIQPAPLLTRSLHRGSVAAWPGIASDQSVLTPDPLGYRDSSNLYAFAGGDPVNGRDPTGEAAFDSEMEVILDLIDRASRDAAAKHGLKSLAEVEAGGDLGTAVHKTMQELLGPGGKYFHPRIGTEVEIDAMGQLIRSGPRGAAQKGSMVKDIVILAEGQDIRDVRPGRLMKSITDYVLDLKLGIRGARMRSTETLVRLGIRPLAFKPYQGVLEEVSLVLKDAAKAEQLLGKSKALRFLKGAGKVGGRLLVVGGVLMVAVQYPANAQEMGHPRAVLQGAYDLIPYSLITDFMVVAVENNTTSVLDNPCWATEVLGACSDCVKPIPGCERSSGSGVEW